VRTLQRKFISARGAGYRRRDSSREPLRAGGHAGDLTAVNHYALAVGPRRWLILGVLCVTLLLVTVDDTILNVALPSISRGLRATSTQLQRQPRVPANPPEDGESRVIANGLVQRRESGSWTHVLSPRLSREPADVSNAGSKVHGGCGGLRMVPPF
jgi:hypothetical protein